MSLQGGPGTWRGQLPALLVVLVTVAACVRLFALIDQHSVDVPFWDQWDLMTPLMNEAGTWELFRFQHGPHRQGIAFVATAWLADASGWSTRAEAFAIGTTIALAAALALVLAHFVAGRLTYTDAAIPMLILTPAQYGIFIHTPNASHGAVPLLLLVLSAGVLLIRNPRARYAGLITIDFLAVHTGFGLFIGVLTPLYFAVEIARSVSAPSDALHSRAGAAVGLALSLAIGALFFVGWIFDPAAPSTEIRLAWAGDYVRYVSLMLANLLGLKGTGPWPVLVGSFLLLMALWVFVLRSLAMLRRSASSPNDEVIVWLVGFGLLFCFTTALGRLPLGLPGAQSSRYVPLVVPIGLGLLLHVSTLEERALRIGLGAFALLTVVVATIPMHSAESNFMERLADGKRRWAETYLERRDIAEADRAARLKIYPWPPERTDLQAKLDYLEERRLSLFRPR